MRVSRLIPVVAFVVALLLPLRASAQDGATQDDVKTVKPLKDKSGVSINNPKAFSWRAVP